MNQIYKNVDVVQSKAQHLPISLHELVFNDCELIWSSNGVLYIGFTGECKYFIRI